MNKLSKTLGIFTTTLLISTSLFGYTYADKNISKENYSTNFNTVNVSPENYTANVANIELESLPDIKTNRIKQGTVTAKTLNVRKGAGTKYKSCAKLKKGNVVTILQVKSGWVKIKMSNGKTGWVSSKYLKIKTVKTTTNNKVSNSTSNTTANKTITITALPSQNSASNTNLNTVVVKPNTSTSNTSVKQSIINKLIKTEGNVSSSSKTTLINNLNKIPTNLLKAVEESGLQVLLTTKNVKDYYKYSFSGTMTGLFDPMAGKIYISSKTSHINQSTIHEFGHALDLLIGDRNYVSLSKDWNMVYKAESHTASASYYKSNAQEYFADAFNRYINNPQALKSSAPKTYNYIHSAINNL